MRFDKGICGVVIVVIALFGTIFAGYFLNVDQETVTVTNYDRVTDVSSLFTYTQQPDYVEYNPAKNYTGYQLSDLSAKGVSYTQASGVNQYPMTTASSTTITVDLNQLNSTQQLWTPPAGYGFLSMYSGVPYGIQYHEGVDVRPELIGYGYGWFDPYMVNADNLITYLQSNNLIPSNTIAITIHPKNSDSAIGLSVSEDISNSGVGYTFINNSMNTLSLGNDSDITVYGEKAGYWRMFNTDYPTNITQQPEPIPATPQQCLLTYDVDSGLWTINANGGTVTATYGILTWAKDNRAVRTWRNILEGNLFKQQVLADEFTLSSYSTEVEVVFSYAPVYDYMKPSEGVAINNTNGFLTTNWSNGKSCGDIAILFKHDDYNNLNQFETDLGSYLSVRWNGATNDNAVRIIDWQNSTDTGYISIGSWDAFILHLSPLEGKVYAVPVMQFNSFTDYQVVDYRIEIGAIPTQSITMLKWVALSPPNSSYKFSVVSTMVQMTTKLLMVNPYLDITDYFQLSEGYRLDINSFAKYGNSMTVNNVTLFGNANGDPISDTNNIYYDGKTYKLTNIQIAKDTLTGHTYINFVNDRKSIDLGASVSDVVSMDGTWYFNTVLDEGKIGEKTQYTWDWANALTSTQSIVVFMGLIVVCSLLARKFWNIQILDLAVIVSAIVLLWTVAELI